VTVASERSRNAANHAKVEYSELGVALLEYQILRIASLSLFLVVTGRVTTSNGRGDDDGVNETYRRHTNQRRQRGNHEWIRMERRRRHLVVTAASCPSPAILYYAKSGDRLEDTPVSLHSIISLVYLVS
jgi:hypothetical protein